MTTAAEGEHQATATPDQHRATATPDQRATATQSDQRAGAVQGNRQADAAQGDQRAAAGQGDHPAMEVIVADRALTVVRAPEIPDPVALADTLAGAGIRAVELTFTTPGVLECLRKISGDLSKGGGAGRAVVGAGTVLNREQAEAAIDAGAQFLVTPGVSEQVAEVAARRDIPVVMGAFTPSEVMRAIELGAAAVKIFPARALGPGYLKDLRGPFPNLRLIPSGGVNAGNAADFLAHGAVAVTAGTDVVPPAAVAAGEWAEIASRAAAFVRALN